MSLKVQCTSCDWRGELIDYNKHVTERCVSRVVQCGYGCGLYYKTSDVAIHQEEECTKRPYDVIVGYYERKIQCQDLEIQRLAESYRQRVRAMEEERDAINRDHIEQVQTLKQKHSQQMESLKEKLISKKEEMAVVQDQLHSVSIAMAEMTVRATLAESKLTGSHTNIAGTASYNALAIRRPYYLERYLPGYKFVSIQCIGLSILVKFYNSELP